MRHSTGGLNKWSIELTRLSQRSVAVSHSIIHIAVSYGNSTGTRTCVRLSEGAHVWARMAWRVCVRLRARMNTRVRTCNRARESAHVSVCA